VYCDFLGATLATAGSCESSWWGWGEVGWGGVGVADTQTDNLIKTIFSVGLFFRSWLFS
jgi:hypothetical protein